MSIEDLYLEVDSSSSASSNRELIDLVEAKKDVLNQTPQNAEEFDYLISLLGHHARRLTDLDSYEKALHYINRLLSLIESRPRLSGQDLLEIQEYENAVFGKGFILFNLKKYQKAENIFSQLSHRFPESDKYSNWKLAAQSWKLSRIRNPLSILVFALVIVLSLFKDQFGSFVWPLLVIILVGIIVGMYLTVHIELNKRKKKNIA